MDLSPRRGCGLGGPLLSGSRWASASRPRHLHLAFRCDLKLQYRTSPFPRVGPPAPKTRWRQRGRDVRPSASKVQLQKFTGPLPAAGGSLPEESTQASVGSLRTSRRRRFHLFEKRIKKGRGKIPALIFVCLANLIFLPAVKRQSAKHKWQAPR